MYIVEQFRNIFVYKNRWKMWTLYEDLWIIRYIPFVNNNTNNNNTNNNNNDDTDYQDPTKESSKN